VTPARQALAALLDGGAELRVTAVLVAGAAQLPVGIGVGKVGHTVVPHALGIPAHLLDKRGVSGIPVLAARGQGPALLERSAERRVILLVMACAPELPRGVGVGKIRYAVGPHALRVALPSLLAIRYRVGVRNVAAGQGA